jgi:DNA-binding CsgD family transcriptional regulator
LVAEVQAFSPSRLVPVESPGALPLEELTPRELAVLEGIAQGLDNAEIAASLRLSEKTVRNHITRVFDKICVDHRYQAIVLAREAGLGRASRLNDSPRGGTVVPDTRRIPTTASGHSPQDKRLRRPQI